MQYDKYFTVQYVFLPDVCHILWASSVLWPRSFRLAKQKTRAQSDLGQNWGALIALTWRAPPPKIPELRDKALVIRKWCLWIYVHWSRDVNETSDLKLPADQRPIGDLQKTLELTSHTSRVWDGAETTRQVSDVGTCWLASFLTSFL